MKQGLCDMIGNTLEHYSDYSLKILASSMDISVLRISITPYQKDFGKYSGITPIDTVAASITLCKNSTGILSRLMILPHYSITKEEIGLLSDKGEDLLLRFSIYPEGNGFFTPTWVKLLMDHQTIVPSGKRIDWDKITNQTYKNTGIRSQKWFVPDMTFEETTSSREE